MPIKGHQPYITYLFGLFITPNCVGFFLLLILFVFCNLKMIGVKLNCTATVEVRLSLHIVLHLSFTLTLLVDTCLHLIEI